MDLVFRNTTKTRTFGEAFFRSLIEKIFKKAGISQKAGVSITLVGLQRMRSLNRQYRHRDESTDVLSFPLGESKVQGYTENILGDIFICPMFAAARAREEGISLQEKMAWLAVHGTLHLAGFDHERSEKEARRMEALENIILKKNGKQSHHLGD